jgi:hypothetical protein
MSRITLRTRVLSVLATLLITAVVAPSTSAQSLNWYDQCGVIDTWYPQAGFGYDQQWHTEVYPVTAIFTRSYIGSKAVYDVCASMVGDRYVEHNHQTRPWDYMEPVCVLYITPTMRAVSYIPRPVNAEILRAYRADCSSAGGDWI